MFWACKITSLTEFHQNRIHEGVRGGCLSWSYPVVTTSERRRPPVTVSTDVVSVVQRLPRPPASRACSSEAGAVCTPPLRVAQISPRDVRQPGVKRGGAGAREGTGRAAGRPDKTGERRYCVGGCDGDGRPRQSAAHDIDRVAVGG